jgi:hypothetical protein
MLQNFIQGKASKKTTEIKIYFKDRRFTESDVLTIIGKSEITMGFRVNHYEAALASLH